MKQYHKLTIRGHQIIDTAAEFQKVVDLINLSNTVGLIEEVEDYINCLPSTMLCADELAKMALEKKWFLLMKMETAEQQSELRYSMVWPIIVVTGLIIWSIIVNKVIL